MNFEGSYIKIVNRVTGLAQKHCGAENADIHDIRAKLRREIKA